MASRTPALHTILVQSIASAVNSAYSQILTELQAREFAEEDIFAVHLCMQEAFLNAVKHGNKMDADKQVRIDYSVDNEKMEIFMTDQGEGFDPDSVPDPTSGDNVYRPRGRGIFLIQSYMDEAEFNDKGNRLRMLKYKQKSQPEKKAGN